MSKFFKGSISDSDSDYSSKSDAESDISSYVEMSSNEDTQSSRSLSDHEDVPNKAPSSMKKNRFIRGEISSESDDDSQKKVLKSAEEKLQEEIESLSFEIEGFLQAQKWEKLLITYDKLYKTITTRVTKGSIKQTPIEFIDVLLDLSENFKDTKTKKTNSANQKALNVLKQKVKKATMTYELEIKSRLNEDSSQVQKDTNKEDTAKEKQTQASANHYEDLFNDKLKLDAKLEEIIKTREKKGADKEEQINILKSLLEKAPRIDQKIEITLILITHKFSFGSSGLLTNELWHSINKDLQSSLDLLSKNEKIFVTEDLEFSEPDKGVDLDKIYIKGSIPTIIEQIDIEFSKSLQSIDAKTKAYVERLKDEPSLLETLIKALVYFDSKLQKGFGAQVVIKIFDHCYYKNDLLVRQIFDQIVGNVGIIMLDGQEISLDNDINIFYNALHSYIKKNGSSDLKIHFFMMNVFNLCIKEKYTDAKELFILSNVQEKISTCGINSQVLYNRCLAMLGMTAFKHGYVDDTLMFLNELYSTLKVKELLAQGFSLSKNSTSAAETVLFDKNRLLPFHMHINLEIIEFVVLSAAMILEIPAMAYVSNNVSHDYNLYKPICKQFRKLFDYYCRQTFSSPPESTKEHVLCSTVYLLKGNWKKAWSLLKSTSIFEMIFDNQDFEKVFLGSIKITALKAYVFSFYRNYASISISSLSTRFEIDEVTIKSLLDKMSHEGMIKINLNHQDNYVDVVPQRSDLLATKIALFDERLSIFLKAKEREYDPTDLKGIHTRGPIFSNR